MKPDAPDDRVHPLAESQGEFASQELMQSRRITVGAGLLLLRADAQRFAPTN